MPVLADAHLSTFLEWLERQQQPLTNVGQPQVSVSSVEVTGKVDEQMAHLDAVIRVEVSGVQQPFRYALGLSEAVIIDSQVEGPGKPVFGGRQLEEGYRWWINGAGSYVFRLKMLVPVRRTAPWRRLQLTVPLAPVSSLQLSVPEATVLVKAPEDVLIETRAVDSGSMQIRAAGFGTRLDVQWQPTSPIADQRTSLDVNTLLLVRGSPSGYLVEATQYVKALQGAFREFTVQLPKRCDLLQVEGTEILRTKADPADPERVTVELQNSTSGTVVVKWSVRIPQVAAGRTMLQGFSVEAARRQSGEIGLLAPDGARWTLSDTNDPRLERMNAGELRSSQGGSNIVRAYRFYDQPFQLPLELQKVEPFFDVRPMLIMYATRDELRLEGRYEIRTFRGRLSELALSWPGWRADGWKLETIEPAGNVVTGLNTEDTGDGDRLLIGISDDSPATFALRFVARCPLPRGENANLSLPKLEGPSTASPRVVFIHAENVDAELFARGETALRLTGENSGLTADALGYPAGLRLREYRLETEERRLTIRVTPQPLRVSVQSLAQAELVGRRLSVRQSLSHRVEYERLASFEFVVPESVAQSIRFEHLGLELLPTWRDGARPRERIAQVTLPQAKLGLVDIDALWGQQLPESFWPEQESSLSIPLLSSPLGNFTRNLFEFERPSWFDIAAADSDWHLDYADGELTRWSAGPELLSFDGLLTPTAGDDGYPFLVSRAAIQLGVERAGLQNYRVQLRLSGNSPLFNLQLPPRASTPLFAWDGVPVRATDVQEFPEGSRRFSIPCPLGTGTAAEQLLTIDYQLDGPPLTGFTSELRAETPRFPQCRWATRIIWSLDLPDDQHVFTPPDRISPLYQWQRDGVIWKREAIVSPTQIQQWLAPGAPVSVNDIPRTTATYAFSQVGPVQALEMRVLSSAATFLCGTGTALLLGFLVIKVPQLRSLLSLLCLVCALMTVALWFLPQFELLLQPMLLGATIAALLGLQEYWSRRSRTGTILTLAGNHSDYRGPLGEGSATHSLLVRGQDSATVFREPAPDDSRSRSAVESHAG